MFASRLPAELRKLIDPERDLEDYRKLECASYGDCLDEAVEKQWTSWTCARCPLFEPGASKVSNLEVARDGPPP
jgi:hypothetical protein